MKVLILCGVFADENVSEVMKHAKRAVEFSANNFQLKLIKGFQQICDDVEVVSAPFIGSYPNASDVMYFKGFDVRSDKCVYVPFNNIWGVRNFSRASALKKALLEFIQCEDKEKLIVVYSAHTPFLEVSAYAKKKDPSIKVALYVPDLPNYMNLAANRTRIYDVAKKYDIQTMFKYMECVDLYVLLTDEMKNMLPVGDKPYIVKEGIIEEIPLHEEKTQKTENCKYIVYTGKLDEKFGIKELLNGFKLLSGDDYRLVLCGRGDCDTFIKEFSKDDERIIALGQVEPSTARAWQQKADVLINPRPNNEEYTKYSFPSKTIEYLLSGNPVVAYKLDGMSDIYKEFIYEIQSGLPTEQAIAEALVRSLTADIAEIERKHKCFCDYALESLSSKEIADIILEKTFA